MAIIISGLDIVNYKPYLRKYSNYERDNNVFNNYITSGISEVERQFSSYIDITDVFLENNEDYLVCYYQYIYFLYLESATIKQNGDSQEVEFLKRALSDYNKLFSRFLTIYDNYKTDGDEPISNNISLRFG